MSLHVVWSSPLTQPAAGEVPGERARLLLTRFKRPARNNQSILLGARVRYLDEPGRVIAFNISAIGRWPAHLYPFLVLLDCGLLVRAHSLDLEVEIQGDTHAGKPESTAWR